ncbi:MAG: prepilin-type N-terminal cleavage/methylation domain-containing protein [Massilia sp.]|jgi:MSHA pilin protein MshD
MLNKIRRSAGVTLVELIVALVIMGVALAGMVAVYATTTRSSVDPVLVQQMQAIADNMMEEILMKPFAQGPAPGAPNGPRIGFDDVRDYDGYQSTGIQDVEGNTIPGLERYTVVVEAKTAALPGVATASDALRITVTVSVTGAANDTNYPKPIVLTGWRTNPS